MMFNPQVTALAVNELAPHDTHKSYYGKAREVTYSDGATALFSYDTLVLIFVPTDDGECKLVPCWQGYSATTMRHINSFLLKWYGKTMNKAEWVRFSRDNYDRDIESKYFNAVELKPVKVRGYYNGGYNWYGW